MSGSPISSLRGGDNLNLRGSNSSGSGSDGAERPVYLKELVPIPSSHLPFEEFCEEFNLDRTSTELQNPRTAKFSKTIESSREEGLSMLWKEDETVINGFLAGVQKLDRIVAPITDKVKENGRIIIVGVGSSGRVALDLTARVTQLVPSFKCHGIIGGGDEALILARPDFEDSSNHGASKAKELKFVKNDVVFLISASGSSSFNVGFGHEAANRDASVYYFYNSAIVPDRTDKLFRRTNNPVYPLLFDTGPQAIRGSTRLQGSSIASISLGYVLGRIISQLDQTLDPHAFTADCLGNQLKAVHRHLPSVFPALKKIIEEQYNVFSSSKANFRKTRDQDPFGYITYLGTPSSFRELLTDAVECPPTFSLSPSQAENSLGQRRSEYRAYLAGEEDNVTAWNIALGRDPDIKTDYRVVEQFILAADCKDGRYTYANRPTANGNMVIGAQILLKGSPLSDDLLNGLRQAKRVGGMTALIVISEDPMDPSQKEILKDIPIVSWIDNLTNDPLGLTFSQALKWQCNLISNSAMALMAKIKGNRMIDVRAGNNKLIKRCMDIILDDLDRTGSLTNITPAQLYQLVISVDIKQTAYQARAEYTPSTTKIILAMLYKNCSFEEALDELRRVEENVDKLAL